MITKIQRLFLLFFLILIFVVFPPAASAQEYKEEYLKAEIMGVVEEKEFSIQGATNQYQRIRVKVLEGSERGKNLEIDYGGDVYITPEQKVASGEIVYLAKLTLPEGEIKYMVADKYRLKPILLLLVGFLALVFFAAGKKSVGAILGLIISFTVIIKFIVPQILDGKDPLLISIAGSLFILLFTIYLAHGFNKQTTIAVISTFLALVATGALSVIFVKLSFLTGLGSEEAYQLQIGSTQYINLQGLLLGGIIIGTLGVLDDITTTQSTAIFELAKTDPRLKFNTLVQKGLSIGREHIASLVNTLVLAYAGASLPVFILFVFNPKNLPIEIILNSEMVTEEIVRTLVGSTGLILAVPLVTIMSAWYVTRLSNIKS